MGAPVKPPVVIVGCGKVGTCLAVFLTRAGYPVAAAVSKSPASARRTASLSGAGAFGTCPWEHTRRGGIVLITTPDGEIGPTCRRIAENDGFNPGCVVLHASGALPSTILEPAKSRGAAVGSLHPLQSFASILPQADPFVGIVFAVEGDEKARKTGETIASDLGGKSLSLRTEGKALYHAAAVAASNYLVSLVDMAVGLLAAAGLSANEAIEVLGPLMKGTLGNIERLGAPAALTGPIARADAETVRRHLAEMRRRSPELVSLYSALGRHTVDVARRGGHLPDEDAVRLLQLFE